MIDQGESKHERKPRQNALKYGGEGAVRRISTGKPFIGLAAEEEKAVTAELAERGVAELNKSVAIRLQTASNLYWNAICKAAQDGDIVALDRYIARYGWLAGKAMLGWAQVSKDDKDRAKSAMGIVDVLKAMYGGENG